MFLYTGSSLGARVRCVIQFTQLSPFWRENGGLLERSVQSCNKAQGTAFGGSCGEDTPHSMGREVVSRVYRICMLVSAVSCLNRKI